MFGKSCNLVVVLIAALIGTSSVRGDSFFVFGLTDVADVNPGDGLCDADPSPVGNLRTLRAAVMEEAVLVNSTLRFNSAQVGFRLAPTHNDSC